MLYSYLKSHADNDTTGEGDSSIIHDVCTSLIAEPSFSTFKAEVQWQQMHHAGGPVPRLVCCQGTIASDGSHPIYRHPSDQSIPLLPYTPAIDAIRQQVQNIVGHNLNHALIQLYRSGEDFISEHSDKTLDIARGTTIVNVSLGAQRTMRLRTKRDRSRVAAVDTTLTQPAACPARRTQLIPLPHGSVFLLGLRTNAHWLHGIKADKRPMAQRSDAERAFGGERISLTFRCIATFLSRDSQLIRGQGSTGQGDGKDEWKSVVNGDADKSRALIDAFGFENQRSDLDRDAVYGPGSDVLHLQLPAVSEMPSTAA